MISRAVVFEDEVADQNYICNLAKAENCEVLIIDNARISEFSERVIKFLPQVAIVDIEFPESQVAGRHILRFLKTKIEIPIVVWSKQMDSPESAKRLYEHCEAIGGVEGLFGKHETLTWH